MSCVSLQIAWILFPNPSKLLMVARWPPAHPAAARPRSHARHPGSTGTPARPSCRPDRGGAHEPPAAGGGGGAVCMCSMLGLCSMNRLVRLKSGVPGCHAGCRRSHLLPAMLCARHCADPQPTA